MEHQIKSDRATLLAEGIKSDRAALLAEGCNCDYSYEGDKWNSHVVVSRCARCRALEVLDNG